MGKWRVLHGQILFFHNWSHGASTAYTTVKVQGNGQVASATRPDLVLPVTALMGVLLLTQQWRYKVMSKWRVLYGPVLYFQ
ncbi:hypothetical protein J6590_080928 [Homalodisca vitripennis]|nr:hypothetical protein J6590_080928 [Homalodisca vitripennis]